MEHGTMSLYFCLESYHQCVIQSASGKVYVFGDKNLVSHMFLQRLHAKCYESKADVSDTNETTAKSATVWLKVFCKNIEDNIKFNAHSEWTAAVQARAQKVTDLHLPVDKFEDTKYIFLVYPVKTHFLSLKDSVSINGPLFEADAKLLVLFTFSTLSNLHQAYLSPLQISPSYILTHKSGFKMSGICSRFQRGVVIGDRRFAAPELHDHCNSHEELSLDEGEKVDVWSTGMVLLFTLTGCVPTLTVDRKVEVDHFLKDHEVSNEAKLFIKLLLQTNPQYRPTVADVLSHNWLASTK